MLLRAASPYVGLAVVAGVTLLFAQWWLKGGARYVVQVMHDSAPEGSSGVDLVVAGTAGTIGEFLGLPTPRQIDENPQLCQQAGTWFDASVNCGVPDLVRWMRGDFKAPMVRDPRATMLSAPYFDVEQALTQQGIM